MNIQWLLLDPYYEGSMTSIRLGTLVLLYGTPEITVNPQISPRGLICKNEFLGRGLFNGRAYSGKGVYFKL